MMGKVLNHSMYNDNHTCKTFLRTRIYLIKTHVSTATYFYFLCTFVQQWYQSAGMSLNTFASATLTYYGSCDLTLVINRNAFYFSQRVIGLLSVVLLNQYQISNTKGIMTRSIPTFFVGSL